MTQPTYSPDQRQHDRIAHLVLGEPRRQPAAPTKPRGMSKQEWKAQKPIVLQQLRDAMKLDSGIERSVALREEFRGRAGTPETLAHASRKQQGVLSRLCIAGEISPNQLAAAEQIRAAVESLRADVALPIASWEARVDGGCSPDKALLERASAVRFEAAYSRWRARVEGPVPMLLDMIVDDVGYSVAAPAYCVGPKRAKRLLLAALDLWWEVRGFVNRLYDDAMIASYQEVAFA